MLCKQTAPLEIANRILQAETMLLIEKADLSLSAQKILDRVALNNPEHLLMLEKAGVDSLIEQIEVQAKQEDDTLNSSSVERAREYGYSDYEIIQELGPPSSVHR